MVARSILKEEIRRMFRLGGATASARHEWLDAIADAARDFINASATGDSIASTSAGGVSVAFKDTSASSPQETIELVAALRDYADAADVDAALLLVPRKANRMMVDHGGLIR